jgi:hypothetical protein
VAVTDTLDPLVGTVQINTVFGDAARPRRTGGDGDGYGPEPPAETTVAHIGPPQADRR